MNACIYTSKNSFLSSNSYSTNERIPAELANDGTAMLVIRNFGYLGVHSSIHPHSKLACDRLVDFTGDMQVRRRSEERESTSCDVPDGVYTRTSSRRRLFHQRRSQKSQL